MKVKDIKTLKKHFFRTFKSPVFKTVVFPLICFLFLFSIFFSFYKDRVKINSFLGKNNLSWQDASQLRFNIDKVLDSYKDKNATFVFRDKIVEVKYREIGVNFDSNATFNKFEFLGQSANPFKNFFNFLASFFKVDDISPVYSFDARRFEEFIFREFADLEEASENAKFVFNNGKVIVSSSKAGLVIDRVFAASQLALRLDRLSEVPIELEEATIFPDVETTELTALLNKYNSLLSKKVILNWDYDSWKIEGDDLISILSVGNPNYLNGFFYEIKNNDANIALTRVQILGEGSPPPEILINDDEIEIFLAKVAKTIDRPTVNATAKFDGRKVTDFKPALDGRKLDVQKTKDQIISFIKNENDTNNLSFSIKLPIITTIAKVANEQINSLGIKELIGKGISYFSGSIANRIYNIELGASRINGTLVAPGEIFSFNNAVGEVSGKTGYRQAYVISSGRTVLDDGGGICQVSTTVFRAALDSGLEIISRTAHAYRVGYYEQAGFGPGLDATVFAPSVDFKFKNDTEHYILIQTVFNRARAMLEIDIYGTRDGRVVEQSKPVILSRTAAPPEIRQDDPTLPKGTVKQIDFAAEGADVYFKRKVLKNDQVLHDDTFRSKFRPWQAIFLVGNGG